MNHPDEDRLLQYVLQTLGESESSDVRTHLSQCERCRELERILQADVERLGSVPVKVDIPEPPGLTGFPGANIRRWGWAAGLAAGFLLGFFVARTSEEHQPIPVPQRLVTATIRTPPSGYVQCQALDVKAFPKP